MKRTMVFLPDDLSRKLRHLAIERETSMAELIREAAAALVERSDMAAVREALAEYRTDPSSAVPLEQYHRRRKKR